MSVKDTARKQYVRIVDHTAKQVGDLQMPSGGWLTMLRKALGMSGADVAKRMNVTRSAVYQAERNELDGAITLKQMKKLAEALGGRFIYTIVPDGSVEDVIRAQAYRKARTRVLRASSHMALESQSLPKEQTQRKIQALAEDLVRKMPSDFWDER